MTTLNILYEDPHILVCVKPHGIATQSKSIRSASELKSGDIIETRLAEGSVKAKVE